jgi:hypothetical protein
MRNGHYDGTIEINYEKLNLILIDIKNDLLVLTFYKQKENQNLRSFLSLTKYECSKLISETKKGDCILILKLRTVFTPSATKANAFIDMRPAKGIYKISKFGWLFTNTTFHKGTTKFDVHLKIIEGQSIDTLE